VTVINPLSEMAPLAIPVYSKVAGSFGGIVFSRRSFVGMRSAVMRKRRSRVSRNLTLPQHPYQQLAGPVTDGRVVRRVLDQTFVEGNPLLKVPACQSSTC